MNRSFKSLLAVATVVVSVAAQAKTKSDAESSPKLLVSPTISSHQRRVLEINLQAAKNQQKIVEIEADLLNHLAKSREAELCLSHGQAGACKTATDATMNVMDLTIAGLEKANTVASNRINLFTGTFKASSQREAEQYNSVLKVIDQKRFEVVDGVRQTQIGTVLGTAMTASLSDDISALQEDLRRAQSRLEFFIQMSRTETSQNVQWNEELLKGFDKIVADQKN